MSDERPLHPHDAFNQVDRELAMEVAEIQTRLQLALLKANTTAAGIVHRNISGDPAVKPRHERLVRNMMFGISADLLLAKLYKELT